MITHSRLAEIRRQLFGRKTAKRPKPPNEAERLYLGAMRLYADAFREIVGGAIAQTYPELLDPANVRKDSDASRVASALKHPDRLGAGAKKRRKLPRRLRGRAVMQEFSRGTLHSGSGDIVHNPAQARAIAAHEGARHDATRVGPLTLGKKAKRVLAGITNPLKAAAEKVPLGQVAGTVKTHVERDVVRYMPGLKNTDLFLGAEVAEWRRENVDLISSFTDDMLEKISDLLEDYDGLRVEDMATALEDTFGLTLARAELIARDQVLKLNGRMNQQAQENAGVSHYRWSTSHDASVRDDHADLDDTIHSWDDPPVVNEDKVAKGKPERREHPGGDFQCRCIAIPVLEEFETPAVESSEELDGGWDETAHPREPAGSSTGGQFAGAGPGSGTVQHLGDTRVNNPEKVHAAARGLLGRDLTHEDVKSLTQVHALDVPGADHVEYEVWPHGSDGLNYEARVLDKEGKELLVTKRQLETNWESGRREVEVHHDLMIVAEHLQGEGLGSKLFDAQLKEYQARGGIDRITTSAAWVGTYQWPRLGFGLTNAKDLTELKAEAHGWLSEHGVAVSYKDFDKVKTVNDLARLTTKSPVTYETAKGPVTTPNLGKAFLINRGLNESHKPLELKFDLGPKSKELKAYAKARKSG